MFFIGEDEFERMSELFAASDDLEAMRRAAFSLLDIIRGYEDYIAYLDGLHGVDEDEVSKLLAFADQLARDRSRTVDELSEAIAATVRDCDGRRAAVSAIYDGALASHRDWGERWAGYGVSADM